MEHILSRVCKAWAHRGVTTVRISPASPPIMQAIPITAIAEKIPVIRFTLTYPITPKDAAVRITPNPYLVMKFPY